MGRQLRRGLKLRGKGVAFAMGEGHGFAGVERALELVSQGVEGGKAAVFKELAVQAADERRGAFRWAPAPLCEAAGAHGEDVQPLRRAAVAAIGELKGDRLAQRPQARKEGVEHPA